MNKNQRIGNEALRNLRVVETKNECKFSPMAENKPGLRNEMINGIEGMGFSSVCRQKFGHLNFELSAIAVICAATAAFYAAPVFAGTSVPQGVYLDLLSGVAADTQEEDGDVLTLNDSDNPYYVNKGSLDEEIPGGNVDVHFTYNGQTAVTKIQNYTGKTYIESGINHQVNVANGVDLSNSSEIYVKLDSQIYFHGPKDETTYTTIQKLSGPGRVGMTNGKVLIVDYGDRLSKGQTETISNQFLSQSQVVFKREMEDDKDRAVLAFDVTYTADGLAWDTIDKSKDWGFESMTFENFDLSMDDPGTQKFLGDISVAQNKQKNIHLNTGSRLLFSLEEPFEKYKLGGTLHFDGGTLNYKGLALEHEKFISNYKSSTLYAKNLKATAETGIEIDFPKEADANFDVWKNQEEAANYLIYSENAPKEDREKVRLLISKDGYYQNINQKTDGNDNENDAILHWTVADLGWEALASNAAVLKYSSKLDAINLTNEHENRGFIINPNNDESNKESVLTVKLTGKGNVIFGEGKVKLVSPGNDYTGKTQVISNSHLVIGKGSSLGYTTGLKNEGTVDASEVENVVLVNGETSNSGLLIIGQNTFTTTTYNGNGTIQVSTLLKGEDSETGKLVVTEKATGEGKVKVVVRDGSIGMDLNRLDVAVLGPDSTLELELAEDVTKDGKSYMLMKTDDSADGSAWYLTTTNKPQKFRPAPKTDSEDSEKPDNASGQTPVEDEKNPAAPDNQGGTGGGNGGSDIIWTTSTLKTPQAGARAGLAYLAAEVFDLSLRGHVGDRVYHDLLTGEERETSLWMLNMGNWSRFGDTTSQLGFDGRTNVTHLGGDLYKWNLNDMDTLRIGLLGSYGQADYKTKSDVTWLEADANFEGWSVGAYASWQTRAESGPFANGQIRWNHFENEVREERLEKDKYDSEGLSATFEAGWTKRLFTKKNSGGYNMAFDLEPRAHFYWMDFDADTGFDSTGQRFDTDGRSNLMTSLGVRASLKLTDDAMPQWSDPAMHFFVEGNWVHYSRDFNATVMNEKGSSTATVDLEDFAEARLGAVMHLSDELLVWGDFNLRSGEDDYESYGYNVGAKYFY